MNFSLNVNIVIGTAEILKILKKVLQKLIIRFSQSICVSLSYNRIELANPDSTVYILITD